MSYRSSWTGKILDGKREDNFSGLERRNTAYFHAKATERNEMEGLMNSPQEQNKVVEPAPLTPSPDSITPLAAPIILPFLAMPLILNVPTACPNRC